MDEIRLTHEDVLSKLPVRDPRGHKGDYGKILLLCGSRGYTGAAALAAMGALRSGAGLVYLGVPECIYEIEAVKLTEPVVFPLPSCGDTLSTDAVKPVLKLLPKMDAVLIGSGLGISEGTQEVVRTVLTTFSGTVVLDADGITLMKPHKDLLRGRTAPTILTPHAGEFQRFIGQKISNRIQDARDLAQELGVVMVLKGHETVITDGLITYVNPTGNPGMAVGGSGDVLAGVITSLLGQGLTPVDAAACGAWLHGAAGDACARKLGQYGMLPSDMLLELPRQMMQGGI